jgi:hypothetical protein
MSTGHQKENAKTEDLTRMATVICPSEEKQSHRWCLSFHTSHNSGTVQPSDTFEASYSATDAPFKGYGKTGGRYKKGQQVMVTRVNDTQEWVITGAVPNSIGEDDPAQSDNVLTASHPTGMALLGSSDGPGSLTHFATQVMGPITGGRGALQKTTHDIATNIQFVDNVLKKALAGPNDPVIHSATTAFRNLRPAQKGRYAAKEIAGQINKSIGAFAFNNANMTDPTAAIKQLVGKAGELIPNAQSMIENLKKSVAGGAPTSAVAAVGGLQLVQQALSGIAMARAGQSDTEEELTDWLCELYVQIFPGAECKQPNGTDTPAFQKWKKDYMLELRRQQGMLT